MNKLTPLTAKLSPIALLLMASSAQAVTNLDTMVVTASRTDTAIADVAATMWVIDQQQIERQVNAGADLKTALGRLIPSFDFGGEGRTNYGQNLRGRSALVMIDGVSLNSTRAISRQLDSIDPFNIAHVEVLSGATAIYGAGAAGGIINIITKKASVGPAEVALNLAGSSGFNNSDDQNKKLALSVAGGSEKLRGRLSAAYQDSGAAYDANGQMILPDITQTDLQFNQSIDIMGNLEFEPDNQQLLSLSAQYYNSEQDSDYGTYLGPNLAGIFGRPDLISVQQGLSLEEQPSTERVMVNGQYQHHNILGQTLMAQLFYRSESMQFFPFPSIYRVTGSPLAGNSYPIYGASLQETDVLGGKLVLVKDFDQVQLTYGIDAESESFSAKQRIYDANTALASGGLNFKQTQNLQRYPDIDTLNIAAFSQAKWEVNNDWSLSGGFRYQHIEHEVGDIVGLLQQHLSAIGMYNDPDVIKGGKSDYNELLFNLSAIYKIDHQQQIWANFSQGFNLPDPAKYYGNGNYDGTYGDGPNLISSINVADNRLSGVKTNAFELGWRKTSSNYDLQVASYYSISDKTTSYNKSTLAVVVNDDQRRIYGIEGQANYYFDNNFYTGLQAHLIKSETESNGAWNKLAAEEASPSNGSLNLGYDNQAYGAELQWQTLADYSDDQGSELHGYSLANLNGYYALPLGQVNFGIQNLFNKDYETLWSQRAQILYSSLSASELFTYKGKGTTFSVSYNAVF
ncbi:TonB-dependent receptor [Agarivorans sp. QJM3NY_29]|uniref:TonB-dependent receptor n=1 Tax=unclassified Agarivorans TaxID=2636026 RepID=UPI003D7E7943